jgi:hypothetical protein
MLSGPGLPSMGPWVIIIPSEGPWHEIMASKKKLKHKILMVLGFYRIMYTIHNEKPNKCTGNLRISTFISPHFRIFLL